MSPKASKVWKFFKVCSVENEHKAECLMCKSNSVSRLIVRGTSSKSYSTKPLWNHLKNMHKICYEARESPSQVDCESTKNLDNQKAFQPTIESTFSKSKTCELKDPKGKVTFEKRKSFVAI